MVTLFVFEVWTEVGLWHEVDRVYAKTRHQAAWCMKHRHPHIQGETRIRAARSREAVAA